ncbi:MMPL family transporter [Bacillus sp. T33-2]|uniref:MMPL family transporter n=1 Tax=Bacillus sp. T33-2 TaxID=2054168 RepID=UPI000C77342D|nr:MMPL family transporter [Bacillus sp. T33-2]PLR98764.1 hypothetical protein CVD19_03760 [Bacillus sp. T33-2]
MNKLGRFIFKYRKTVIFIWLAIIAFFGFFAMKLPSVLSGNGFEFNGEYKKTRQIIDTQFNEPKTTIIVLFEKEADINQQAWEKFIKDSLDNAKDVDNVNGIISPFEQEGMLKDRTAYGVLTFEKEPDQIGETIDGLREALQDKKGLKVSITGEPVIVKDLNQASQEDLAKAEMIGLPIAMIVLVLAFGSLVASGIPLLIGVVTILTTMGVVYFFSYSFDLTIFILNIVPMIGLALSIDFALLFINRFKEEMNNKPVGEAVAATVETAGRSIIFSALCVFIGLLGLMFIQIDIFQNVALGGMTVVFISAVSAITFLPALLSLIGKNIHAFTVIKVNSDKPGAWSRFAHFVMKRPAAMAIIALIFLVTGLIPVKDMNMTVPGIDALPPSYSSRIAYEKFEEEFVDRDKNNDNKVPVIIQTDGDALGEAALETAQIIIKDIQEDNRVHSVESVFSVTGMDDTASFRQAALVPDSPIGPAVEHFISGDKMLVNVYLTAGLSAEKKHDWVRSRAVDREEAAIFVGGNAKFEQEIFDEIFKKAPKGLALILISTFLILMAAFKSVLIPLKAILMNIMSLSATFGIVVWVFQKGHLGADPSSIALILPVFVFSLVFGLSMDYEVFLISRIHEVYLETRNNHYATLNGLISTSKIITSAAAIMIVVTGAFAFTGVMPVKQMGVGIALAIFIDATIIRMVLVPSLMKLLGDCNWWFFGIKQSSPLKSEK